MLYNKINIRDLAHYLVLYFMNEGIPISHIKLQKLLYYIQSWHITLFEKETFFEELPEAWVNGPVFRTIYDEYQSYSMYQPIVGGIDKDDVIDEMKITFLSLDLDEEKGNFLNAVIKKYGYMSDEQIVYLSHVEAPWNDTRKGLGPFDKSTNKITIESIYNYYSKRLKNNA